MAPKIASVPPRNSQILPSEMLLFVSLCRAFRVATVIESGRRQGYSTECLLACGFDVISIESDPDHESDKRLVELGAKLITGSAEHVLPKLTRPESWALLLDGPKGIPALRLAGSMSGYKFYGIHDLYRGTPQREEAERRDGFFTDDEAYLSQWGHVDAEALKHSGHPDHGVLSEAYVLGVMA